MSGLKRAIDQHEKVKISGAPATAATTVITLVAGTDFPTAAERVRITGYGVHYNAGAAGAGDVAFVVNSVQVAPSTHLSNFAPKNLILPPGGIPITPGGQNIVITYTHGASVSLQSWVTYREE